MMIKVARFLDVSHGTQANQFSVGERTTIDSLGWVAEMRIPFSQLRFSRSTNQIWGIQIGRAHV